MSLFTAGSGRICVLWTFSSIFLNNCFHSFTGNYSYGSVYCSDRKCTYKKEVLDYPKSTAVGVFNDTLMETGWGILDIISGHGKPANDIDIMYAAGFLEGALTAP